MRKDLLKSLACPVCKGNLEYQQEADEMICANDRIAFPVRNGIVVLLEMDARKLNNNEK
jgi:hypothetical protein